MEIWVSTKTVHADGSETVNVQRTEDRELLGRLNELTAEGYHDPEVQVLVEDFGDGEEDGSWSSGTRVRLRRRTIETEQELRENIERTRGVSYAQWQRRQDARTPLVHPSREERLERDLHEAAAAGEEQTTIVVDFVAEPATRLPPRHTSPAPLTELEKVDAQLVRTEAMAARGQEILELQQPFVDWLASEGGEVSFRYWSRNSIAVRAPAALMRQISARADVASVERSQPTTPDAVFDRQIIRSDDKGIQAEQFWTAGYYGEVASSRNSWGIWLGVIEASDGLSLNHQGLDDIISPSSRVKSTWDCDVAPCDSVLDACTTLHGMSVASVAVADFMQDQHPAVVGPERGRRSGIAREAFISFLTYDGPTGTVGLRAAVERAMTDNLDIVNHSAGQCCNCNPLGPTTDEVNDAYLDGILWINSLGSETYCAPPSCTANNEAAAYGSIAVAAHDSFNDGTGGSINNAFLCETNSSDGRASWGPVPDLAAPGGAYAPMSCVDTFQADTVPCATSFAAPHVSGAAAILMNHLTVNYSDATAHSMGKMHALLLAMGDGCGGTLGIDGRWGAGRLKLRKLDTEGLDAPWKVRSSSFNLTSADHVESWYLNEDAQGFPIAVPGDVDAFIATAWCRHEDPSAFTGEISLDLWDLDLDQTAVFVDDRGEKNKLTFNPLDHRYIFQINVTGIPFGTTVPCYVWRIYEDSDRDDANGPAATIEPWYVSGGGSTAPTCQGSCL